MGKLAAPLKLFFGICFLISLSYLIRFFNQTPRGIILDRKFPITSSCPSPRNVEIYYQSSVVIHKELTKNLDSTINESIELQSRFLRGALIASHNLKTINHKILINTEKKEFKILDRKPTSYGLNLIVTTEKVLTPNAYVEAARAKKILRPEDLAETVTYEARLSGVECYEGSEDVTTVQTFLPIDPQLAFWIFPKETHVEMKMGKKTSLTAPCTRSVIALLEAEELIWYAWDPTAKSPGFDCKRELLERNVAREVKVELRPVVKKAEEFEFNRLKNEPEIDVGIIWGRMQDDTPQPIEYNLIREKLKNQTISLKTLKKIHLDLRKKKIPEQDIGFITLLDSVIRFGELVKGPQFSIEIKQDHILMDIGGMLKESGRKINIRTFYGSTYPHKSKEYQKHLLDFLQHKEIVFYIGHSGMGYNVKLKSMSGHEHIKESSLKYQFFGIISCFSMASYGFDYLDLRPNDSQTDLLLTYSESYSFLLPYSLLQFLDMHLADKHFPLSKQFATYSYRDDIIWMDRFEK